MNAQNLAGIVASLSILAACTDGGSRTDVSVRRDSAGITIVENLAPAWQPGEEWRVDTVPLLAIDPDAGPGAEFQEISGVARLDDGTIVATDFREPFVRAFDGQGRLTWTAVREGGGPGELRAPGALSRIRGDSLILEARGPDPRAVLLSPDGQLVADLAGFAPPPGEHNDGAIRRPGTFFRLSSGDAFSYASVFHPSDAEGPGIRVIFGEFYLAPRDQPATPLGSWPATTIGNGLLSTLLGARLATAPLPDGFVYGWPTRDELSVYDAEGTLRILVRGSAASRAPTSDEIAVAKGAYLQAIGDSPANRQFLENYAVADSVPHFRTVVGSATGEVWRERFDARTYEAVMFAAHTTTWDVFSPEGTLLGAVEVPARFRLLSVGDDWIAGVHADEMDVQTPRVYRVAKP